MKYLITPLLLFTLLFITQKPEKALVNKKIPSAGEILQQLDKHINKGPVQINYIIHSCFSKSIYKICLDKKENNYSLELSIPLKPQGGLEDYNELIKEVSYHKTYTLSTQKLEELKSALIPNRDKQSTTIHSWSIKMNNDSLKFNDGIGGHGLEEFISSLAETDIH